MSHTARIVSSSFLLLCVACPSGKPPPPAEPAYQPAFKDVRIRWTEPQCFGYAADKDAFACLDFALRTDSAGPEEPEPMDFSKWQPDPGTVYSGHKSFALVAAESGVIKLSEKQHDDSRDIKHSLSQVAALIELEQKGYRPGVEPTPLEPGEWLDVAGVSLRFRTTYHSADTDDPDDYHAGSLQMVCPRDMVSSAIELLPKKRGQRAIAFAAPEAKKSLVVSVLESGGSDGWYFKINNVRIDIAARCEQ